MQSPAFFKIFSNFVHFCPNFKYFTHISCAYLHISVCAYFLPFYEKSNAYPYFLEYALTSWFGSQRNLWVKSTMTFFYYAFFTHYFYISLYPFLHLAIFNYHQHLRKNSTEYKYNVLKISILYVWLGIKYTSDFIIV